MMKIEVEGVYWQFDVFVKDGQVEIVQDRRVMLCQPVTWLETPAGRMQLREFLQSGLSSMTLLSGGGYRGNLMRATAGDYWKGEDAMKAAPGVTI